MNTRIFISLLLVTLIGTACGGTANTGTSATPAAGAATPIATSGGIEPMLAAGTLSLEGTDNAVTMEQAKALLPLWKAVKTLSGSDTATQDEIQAVYKQIQGEMTAAQLDGIKALDLNGDKMVDLMSEYGVEPGGPQVVQRSDSSTNPGQGFPPGGMTGPGGADGASRQFSSDGVPPIGGGRVFVQGGDMGGVPPDAQDNLQATPGAGGAGRRFMGMNNLFVDPLITLLKERAG